MEDKSRAYVFWGEDSEKEPSYLHQENSFSLWKEANGDEWCIRDWNEKSATIERFTGLKDKNGKLIYEGDIVKTNTFCNGHETNVKKRPVFLIHGCWSFSLDGKDSNSEPLFEFYHFDLEIIGNIHQNPELLKT